MYSISKYLIIWALLMDVFLAKHAVLESNTYAKSTCKLSKFALQDYQFIQIPAMPYILPKFHTRFLKLVHYIFL